ASDELDREAPKYQLGQFAGSIEEVRFNIERGGVVEVCEFTKGWFEDTLPRISTPIALLYLDVDLESSLHTCLVNLWPRLIEHGYLFTDEFVNLNYCAAFFSERYWHRYFDREPPGLLGAGVGLALGEFYVGPHEERGAHPMQ